MIYISYAWALVEPPAWAVALEGTYIPRQPEFAPEEPSALPMAPQAIEHLCLDATAVCGPFGKLTAHQGSSTYVVLRNQWALTRSKLMLYDTDKPPGPEQVFDIPLARFIGIPIIGVGRQPVLTHSLYNAFIAQTTDANLRLLLERFA